MRDATDVLQETEILPSPSSVYESIGLPLTY